MAAGSYLLAMGETTWPAGCEARAIDIADVEAWAELMAANEKTDQVGMSYSQQDLIDELTGPNLDRAADTLGLWADERMVGYAMLLTAKDVLDVDRIEAAGGVHPEWRRCGLGSALMPWLIQRATDLHAQNHPDTSGEVHDSAISTNIGADRLLRKFGFEECRYFFDMKRWLNDDVPQMPLADGMLMVPFDTSMDEALRASHNEAFLDHWAFTPQDAASWKAWCTGNRAFRTDLSRLVLDGDTIAAYVLGFEWEADTEATGIRELYVGYVGTLRAYRGRGLARAALATVMRCGAHDGYQRAGLGVDAASPTGALALYESLGFSVHSKSITYRLPL